MCRTGLYAGSRYDVCAEYDGRSRVGWHGNLSFQMQSGLAWGRRRMDVCGDRAVFGGQTKSGDIVHCNVFEWHLLPARSIAEKALLYQILIFLLMFLLQKTITYYQQTDQAAQGIISVEEPDTSKMFWKIVLAQRVTEEIKEKAGLQEDNVYEN